MFEDKYVGVVKEVAPK